MTAAIDAAVAAAPIAAALPSHARAEVLGRIGAGVAERKEDLARLLAAEAGKPLGLARGEIDRAVFVFQQGAEEAKRIGGEVIPMDLAPQGDKRWGLTRRFPLSPISAIIPFNFPIQKESGQGREGVRYAIKEMTELRLLVIGGK